MGKITKLIRNWFSEQKNQERHPFAQEKQILSESYKIRHIQPTPNPDAFRFVTNKSILGEGTIHFDSSEKAKGDMFAEVIFQIFGIENIFIKDNFVTVTKSPIVSWESISPQISKVIESSLCFYNKSHAKRTEKEDNEFKEFIPEEFLSFSYKQKEKIINAIFDHAIRPALANDGGDLELVGIKGNIIQIHYQGACGTCPSSTKGTLQYIENMIKKNLHQDLTVEAVQ